MLMASRLQEFASLASQEEQRLQQLGGKVSTATLDWKLCQNCANNGIDLSSRLRLKNAVCMLHCLSSRLKLPSSFIRYGDGYQTLPLSAQSAKR